MAWWESALDQEGTHWEGMSHQKINEMFARAQLDGLSDARELLAEGSGVAGHFDRAAQLVSDALRQANAVWEGAAADAMCSGVSPLVRHALTAKEHTQLVCDAVWNQIQYVSSTVYALPQVVDVPLVTTKLTTSPYVFVLQRLDQEVMEALAREAEETARAVARSYSNATRANTASLPIFEEAPRVTSEVTADDHRPRATVDEWGSVEARRDTDRTRDQRPGGGDGTVVTDTVRHQGAEPGAGGREGPPGGGNTHSGGSTHSGGNAGTGPAGTGGGTGVSSGAGGVVAGGGTAGGWRGVGGDGGNAPAGGTGRRPGGPGGTGPGRPPSGAGSLGGAGGGLGGWSSGGGAGGGFPPGGRGPGGGGFGPVVGPGPGGASGSGGFGPAGGTGAGGPAGRAGTAGPAGPVGMAGVGNGAGGGAGDRERQRPSYLEEEDDVWLDGIDQPPPPVIGDGPQDSEM
ncbi:hypothetical protein LX15_005099 [Streptoalloteichus tenebrarius]|uniref:PPE family domain-containing protein n=1 Tax=Streptoalloteichus tenebrarius (strain ATCC 17920 / DSM 40477 / JCM 4838 / CBS 697.72 / NBRC 16177 / NCIMB 11028 / NRRL B-12390 / A12253. 1 / ISP 5477) TaxID=1933 RepID=A0ABT1I0T4_STRSD|nr:hypothetical protein [Streptoalloteichus tenebrarius]MCP2261375.1 hypothetical protein [Streptoalloteichus tenebrarius]BFF00917.1 hypothetical protein GCM10020241_25920 [Streptoalloteichus tenebrarius]